MTQPHWLFHRWTRWETYEASVTRVYHDLKEEHGSEIRQRRTCDICGLEQQRVVRPAFRPV